MSYKNKNWYNKKKNYKFFFENLTKDKNQPNWKTRLEKKSKVWKKNCGKKTRNSKQKQNHSIFF